MSKFAHEGARIGKTGALVLGTVTSIPPSHMSETFRLQIQRRTQTASVYVMFGLGAKLIASTVNE